MLFKKCSQIQQFFSFIKTSVKFMKYSLSSIHGELLPKILYNFTALCSLQSQYFYSLFLPVKERVSTAGNNRENTQLESNKNSKMFSSFFQP